MQITIKDNHTFVIADEGNYVGLKDRSVFGEALSLGINVTVDDVIEEPIGNWQSVLSEEPLDNLIIE